MKLSLIILSYNTKALTLQCLKSLTSQRVNELTFEIIIVDNASIDGSPDAIAQAFPNVKIIRSSRNLGFAAGNNLGLKVAAGDYVMLLNSDTEIKGQAIYNLINFLDHHPKAGAVTPKVILSNGQIDLACHRGFPTPWNALTYFSHLEALFPGITCLSGYHQLAKKLNLSHQIDATAATALMIRKSVLDSVGFLDEQFFLYGEDLDFCYRLKKAGWEIWYLPEAVVLHHKSASGKKNQDPLKRRQSINHFYDTMKQFYEKHYTRQYPRWLRQVVYWGIDLKKKVHF